MYQRILVPVDGSTTSTSALREAIKVAKNQGSALRLVHVVNELILTTDDVQFIVPSIGLLESLRADGRAILKRAEALVREQGIEPQCVLAESIGRQAAHQIIEQAEQWPADLIVMGTHGRRGLHRLLMGSDAEQVLRAASVPVLLVRSQ